MQDRTVYSLLMMAGAFPFLACALLPLVGVESITGLGRLDALATLYGVTILSFLTGIHWATQLYLEETAPTNLFVVSNVVFLAVLVTYIAASIATAIVIQLVAFALLLAIDYRLHARQVVPAHYLRLRLVATAIAWLSLAFILVTR